MSKIAAFLDPKTRKPMRNGVVNCTANSKWIVYTIVNFVISEFCQFESGQGREVMQACESLARTSDSPWLCAEGLERPIPVIVPDPEFCTGCGRRLFGAECPLLLSQGRAKHPQKGTK